MKRDVNVVHLNSKRKEDEVKEKWWKYWDVSGIEMESALRAIPPSTTLSNNRILDYV
jgi:hypothetical protein